jgi:Ran GTPase-activating protein (RanGAP) involved in mRNA processing and transport
MSEQEFDRMRCTPLSDAIVNPLPEPVEIAPEAELAPLYGFLNEGLPLRPNALGDMTFDRGTLTTDHRLDLCKQVIGPRGVTGLFDALAKDRQSQRHVQHILLGNNICGEELPAKVAEYIRAGNSQLTTWYIAGNRFTGASIAPLCEVLESDCQVRQLWLKRNPLKTDGALQITRVLRANTYLQVLDVSFCGLLDAGETLIVEALGTNTALRNIYLDANGLTEVTAGPLAKLLQAPHVKLDTLSIGLNRLYDEGAEILAGAVASNVSLSKVCVASCGIGASGMKAIAQGLVSNRSLVELDVGFLKATAATGELPNRAEDSGCIALADALRQNATLRSLKLSHNGIGVQGRQALRDTLCDERSNLSLVSLEYEQLGMPRESQLLREEIAGALLRNWAGLEDSEQSKVKAVLRSPYLAEIASVYRLGNVYSPGPVVDDTSW